MELQIERMPQGGEIIFNFDSLKAEISAKAQEYAGMVYTEDSIKQAKEDRALLNKFVNTVEGKRKEIKRQFLAPYDEFEKKIKELTGLMNEPISLIDAQIKAFEERQKQEKREKIQTYFDSLPKIEGFDELTLDKIFDFKWLNATASMKSIEEAISNKMGEIKTNITTISNLPQFAFEATEVYKKSLDIVVALNEANRWTEMALRKQEVEEKKEEKQEEQLDGQISFTDNESFDSILEDSKAEKVLFTFDIMLTGKEYEMFSEFMKEHNIEYSMR